MRFYLAYNQIVLALTPLYGEREAASIARIVFQDGFGISNMHSEQLMDPEEQMQLEDIKQRLLQGEPVQYVMEVAWFYGYPFFVNEQVLIPRPETEELVYLILEYFPQREKTLRVLDVGIGSGCIPVTLKKKRPDWDILGVEVSAGALEVARKNASDLEAEVRFLQLDFRNLADWPSLGSFDLIVSNPPYIPYREAELMPRHVLDFEPKEALFVSDEDPLLFYRLIGQFGHEYLNPGGQIFLECNEFNAQEVQKLMQEWYPDTELKKDLSGKERMIRCSRH